MADIKNSAEDNCDHNCNECKSRSVCVASPFREGDEASMRNVNSPEDKFKQDLKQVDLTKWLKEHGYEHITAHVLQLFIDDVVVPEFDKHQKQFKEWLESFDDFLVQWLWNDFPTPKSMNMKYDEGEAFWTVNYYPSQDLDIILSFRERLGELVKP